MVQFSISSTQEAGNTVSEDMFATNFLTRYYNADPTANFAQAVKLVGATGLRFPGGSMTEESFLVTDPNRATDDQGRKLTPLDDFLELAKAIGSEVTIVIPTRGLFGTAVDQFGNRYVDPADVTDVRQFVTDTLTTLKLQGGVQVTDLIKAFELGNEYWGSGEMTSTEYGRVVNALAPVIMQAVAEVLGQSAVGEIGILAQMGGPWGSDFDATGIYGTVRATSDGALLSALGLDAGDFGSDGKLTWTAKIGLANADIIEQISTVAKGAVTGLVEHFYLRATSDDLTFSSATLTDINSDLQIWQQAGYADKAIVISEWNIQDYNQAQYGLKGAGAFLFQFESMIRLGVDEAFTWPLLSSRMTELAGGFTGKPYLTPAGAALQHMANNLTDLKLLEVEDETPGLEIAAYGSGTRVVLYISSRQTASINLDADVANLVSGFDLMSAERLGVDMTTSNGQHTIDGVGTFNVAYYAEHDVKALVSGLDEAAIFDGSTISATLGSFETLMLVFERSEVLSMVSFTLPENKFCLTLGGTVSIDGTGNALDNVLQGNSGANRLYGGAGNDTLNGGTGRDTLTGGTGNDTYLTDRNDTFIESSGGGTDTVVASLSHTLSGNIENLTLTGSGNTSATGNALNNKLVGNASNNTLNGGTGTDTLTGGAGNDTYYTDGNDTFIEEVGGGTDTVIAAINHSLFANIENLTLTGTKNIFATGNALNNCLTGNAGNNTLNGGTGNDTLIGGAGNDTYYTDGADTFIEVVGGGTDTVYASITHSLFDNLENLTLTGTKSCKATGNALNNVLVGNTGNNILYGGSGDDTLNGGAGEDTYFGGAGVDCFVFDASLGGTNRDTISDFSVADDTIRLDDAFLTGLAAGALSAAAFAVNTSGLATNGSHRVIYESDTGKLFFDADGTGGQAAINFAVLMPQLALTSADFFVF